MSRLSRSKSNAIIASAATVGSDDKAAIARIQTARRQWQRQSADLYYRLAELHYPANYMGGALSRFSYPVGEIPADNPDSPPVVLAGKDKSDLYRAAEDAVWALEGPLGGMPELSRLYAMNMTMTGEGWLVGNDKPTGTEWEFLSIRELVPTDQGGWIRNSVGSVTGLGTELDYRPDYTKRFWRADPFATQVADAAMAALVGDCRQLVALNESITSRIVTRLAQAGILFLDSTLQVPGAIEAPTGDGNAVKDPFYSKLLQTLEAAIMERSGPSGSIPIIVRGQGKPEDLIKFITMDRTIDRVEMELRAELRNNIAVGMDLPAETQQGLGDATHFQAWNIGDATYQSHILPEAQRWADGVTRVYLWPALKAWVAENRKDYSESDIRRIVIVADGANVVTRPNQGQDLRDNHDRLIISDEALRRGTNVPETDKPDDDEYVRQLGRKTNDPYLATWMLPVQDKIDWDKVARTPQGAPGVGGSPPSKQPASPSDPTGAPGIRNGKRNASDRADVWAAATIGFLSAAHKVVGAKVRAACEPHPDLFATVKRFPNEKVLASLEREDFDTIDLTTNDIDGYYRDALAPLAAYLTDLGDGDPADFIADLASVAASGPTHPITPAMCKHLALDVLSSDQP